MTLFSLITRRGGPSGPPGSCAHCRRTPLPGELVHVFAGDLTVCSLCRASAPAESGEPLRCERVHASERPLAVVPRAA